MKLLSLSNSISIGLLLASMVTACGSGKRTTTDKGRKNEPIIIKASEPALLERPNNTRKLSESEIKIRDKYCKLLNISPDSIKNVRLYVFIDNWLKTPYQWGGTSRTGIDCSAFIQLLLADVYKINLPRTSFAQFYNNNVELFKGPPLSEGRRHGFFYHRCR